jgi:CheY-like chemotaxis protein
MIMHGTVPVHPKQASQFEKPKKTLRFARDAARSDRSDAHSSRSQGSRNDLVAVKQGSSLDQLGCISVHSAPRQGSLFRVELPVACMQETELSPIKAQADRVVALAPKQSGYRILIVDDQTENSMLLAEILELPGLALRLASNGQEAVEMFAAWQPHLIWMDIRMPVLDGIEASRQIRALAGGSEVKIVAVTASVLQEDLDTIAAAGMDGFVHKPYQFKEIFDALTNLLGVQFIHE